MKVDKFKDLVKQLTGRSATTSPSDEAFLSKALENDERTIDCSQFNELLLIANKDRGEEAFFQYFFLGGKKQAPECRIKDIEHGVENFQKSAMLCFGNFIYAYRTLSKIPTVKELKQQLGDHCRDAAKLEKKLSKRRDSILSVIQIDHDQTYLLGYISSGVIREEHKIATSLCELLQRRSYATWDDLRAALESLKPSVKDTAVIDSSLRLVDRFRKRATAEISVAELRQQIEKDLPNLNELYQSLEKTELIGIQNTDVYLTWDHMDIYFATSMRKRWEYEDLFAFVRKVMQEEQIQQANNKTLKELNIRHFDPTQSFDKNRINKGLIESLMLKRAACTVYSVQDTDTLGKDSELAATLAQGKPVIAYAPQINIGKRIIELRTQHPATLKERLQFVLYADERVLASDITSIRDLIPRLERFEDARLWRSLTDPAELTRFQEENKEDLERLCRIIASSEQRIYEKRADTLKRSHPLAIQVNLDTGVANGVIVVRDAKTCADLIWRILTNTIEFDMSYDKDTECWLLRERLTQSIFRVVTSNLKLTNCFWNFYPEREAKEE